MPLDIDRIKRRQEETRTGQLGDRWKPKKGVNRVRIFKFVHKVEKDDLRNGFYAKEKLGKKVEEIDRPVTVHFNVSKDNRPVLSNGKLLNHYKRLIASKDETDQKQARSIQPQTKYAINLADTSESPLVMRHWLCPKAVYNDILGTVLDPDYGEAVLGPKGRDFVIIFDPDKQGSDMYSVKVRDRDKCQKLSEKLLEKVQDFYSDEGMAALGILIQDGDAKSKEDEEDADEDESDEEDEGLEDEEDDDKD